MCHGREQRGEVCSRVDGGAINVHDAVASVVAGTERAGILTKRHSSALNGCSGAVHTHSKHSCALNRIPGVFNTYSKAFTHTQ